MLSDIEFIKRSLSLHLFFARIMKEHAFFLEAGFTPKNASLAQQADAFKTQFGCLLADVVALSNGVVSPAVLQSGEVITPFTLNAEVSTEFFSGVQLQTAITRAEGGLAAGCIGGIAAGGAVGQIGQIGQMMADPVLVQRVSMINNRAIELISALARFKTALLAEVLNCRIFTFNYPLLIDHILREARLYLCMVQKLQNREEIESEKDALEQEMFWNRIMAEHAKFIRGFLDPMEEELIQAANDFGNEFDELTAEAKAAMQATMPAPAQTPAHTAAQAGKVTGDSLEATRRIRDFKAQGTQGLLACNIRSIIIPLLGDHVLREANHYLRLLQMFHRV